MSRASSAGSNTPSEPQREKGQTSVEANNEFPVGIDESQYHSGEPGEVEEQARPKDDQFQGGKARSSWTREEDKLNEADANAGKKGKEPAVEMEEQEESAGEAKQEAGATSSKGESKLERGLKRSTHSMAHALERISLDDNKHQKLRKLKNNLDRSEQTSRLAPLREPAQRSLNGRLSMRTQWHGADSR